MAGKTFFMRQNDLKSFSYRGRTHLNNHIIGRSKQGSGLDNGCLSLIWQNIQNTSKIRSDNENTLKGTNISWMYITMVPPDHILSLCIWTFKARTLKKIQIISSKASVFSLWNSTLLRRKHERAKRNCQTDNTKAGVTNRCKNIATAANTHTPRTLLCYSSCTGSQTTQPLIHGATCLEPFPSFQG